MTSIQFRLARDEDILISADKALGVFDGEEDMVDGCRNCLTHGRLYTLVDPDGNIGGVIGGILLWKGTATLGSILTHHIHSYPLSYMRSLPRFVETIMNDLDLHRVEFAIKADYEAGHRWAKALGFQPEGTLRKYRADKADAVMYGRVR